MSADSLLDLRSLAVVLSGTGFVVSEFILQPSSIDHLHNPGIGQTSVVCQFVDPPNNHSLALSPKLTVLQSL